MVTWTLWGKRGRASSGCFPGYPPSLRRAAFLWRWLTAVVNLVMVPRCPSIQLQDWGWFWLVVAADDDGSAGLTGGRLWASARSAFWMGLCVSSVTFSTSWRFYRASWPATTARFDIFIPPCFSSRRLPILPSLSQYKSQCLRFPREMKDVSDQSVKISA